MSAPSRDLRIMQQRSGEWLHFGGTEYLRKTVMIDNLLWEVEFEHFALNAVSPYGGLLALVDHSHLSTVLLFYATGLQFADVSLPHDGGRILDIGWSMEDQLIVASSKPACFILDLTTKQFSHKLKLSGSFPLSAVRGNGLFVLTDGGVLDAVILQEKREPRQQSATVGLLVDAPRCLAVVADRFTEGDVTVVYIGGKTQEKNWKYSLFAVGFEADRVNDVEDLAFDFDSSIAEMRVSPDGMHLALLLDSGCIHVLRSDASQQIHSILLGINCLPKKFEWCGTTYLHVLCSQDQFADELDDSQFSLLVCAVKPTKPSFERLEWDFEGSGKIISVSEVDGLRILSERSMIFVEVVPKCLVNIYRQGSTDPMADLLLAYLDAEEGDVTAFTGIRTLANKRFDDGSTFAGNLERIFDAALAEYTIEGQERLLSVVLRCKNYTTGESAKGLSEVLVDVQRRLRMLNYVRSAEGCGFPITFAQYRYLAGGEEEELRSIQPREAQVLVDRLVNRGDFDDAFRVATFMKMKTEKMLVRWSTVRVTADEPDDVIHNDIVRVLKSSPGAVSFADAALAAQDARKSNLSVKLLQSEARSHNQVLLLLQMHQDELAIEQAVASGDADLIFLVLTKMFQQLDSPRFFSILNHHSVAQQLFVAAAHSDASEKWRDCARDYMDDYQLEFHVAHRKLAAVLESLARENEDLECVRFDDHDVDVVRKSGPSIAAGTQAFDKDNCAECSDLLALSNDERAAADAKSLKQHIQLLQEQNAIAGKLGDQSVINCSVVETISYCFRKGEEQSAEFLRRTFNVSEKKFWFLRLTALCASANWDGVDKLGGIGRYPSVRSTPIGFLPFIEKLYECGQTDRAVAFTSKLPDLVDRVEWYVRLDEFQRATDDAHTHNDYGLLEQIRLRSFNPQMQAYIESRMRDLRR